MVNKARLRVWPDVVLIDREKLASNAPSWTRRLQVSTELLNAAASKNPDVKPPKAFADYIVTRWIHRYVFHSDIDGRPLNQALPQFGDQERRLLAESMNESVERCGLKVDKGAIENGRGKWKTVADVRSLYLKSVS